MPRLWSAGVATDAGRQQQQPASQPPSDAHVVVLKLWLGERDSLTDRLQCLAARVLFTVSSCLTPVPCCASYNCTDYWRYDRIPYITGSNTCAAAAAAHRLLFSSNYRTTWPVSTISKREQNRFFSDSCEWQTCSCCGFATSVSVDYGFLTWISARAPSCNQNSSPYLLLQILYVII